MPWSRLRTARPGDTTQGLRRHSTVDPLSFQNHNEHNTTTNNPFLLGHDAHESVKTPSPLRKSFEPSAVEQATSTERAQTPMVLEQPQKHQRFNILKYRHLSDPQVAFSPSPSVRSQIGTGPWLIPCCISDIKDSQRS